MLIINYGLFKKAREAKVLSRPELARLADLSTYTIAQVEDGFAVKDSTARKILEALGYTIQDNPSLVRWVPDKEA
jgi:transcriptional regulator with XRE-family HTH domain